MSIHQVNFTYNLPEFGSMEIDIDPVLDPLDKEDFAIREIKEVFSDITDLEITEIKEI
jgi:hypothetical protein